MTARPIHRFADLIRCRRGGTALEVAVLAPLALLMLTGVADHGMMLQQKMRLEAAARAGVEVLANHPGSSGIPLARSAAIAAAGGTGVTVPLPTQVCECPGTGGAAGSCATIACPAGAAANVLLTVTVQRSYQPLFRYPWVDGTVPLSGQATLRVR